MDSEKFDLSNPAINTDKQTNSTNISNISRNRHRRVREEYVSILFLT